MKRDAVHAMADLGGGVGDVLRMESFVDRLPGGDAVVAAKRSGGGDGDEHSLGIAGIEKNRVQTQSAGARLPARSGAVAAEARKLAPGLPAVGGAEQRGVLD